MPKANDSSPASTADPLRPLDSRLEGRWRYDGALKWTLTIGLASAQCTDMGGFWLVEIFSTFVRPEEKVTKRLPDKHAALLWATEWLLAADTERELIAQAQEDGPQLKTVTGRLASGPNLQNLPRSRK